MRNKRLLLSEIREEYYPEGIPNHLVDPYLYVINRVLKGKQ